MAMKRAAQTAGSEGYEQWSKEELISRIRLLEKNQAAPSSAKKSRERPFDFEAYPFRQVAIKFAYLGWNYYGFASQTSFKKAEQSKADGEEKKEEEDRALAPFLPTVEDSMFAALQKTKLIKDRYTCNYSRCGRTDAGVSAASQVISVRVRASGVKLGQPGCEDLHDIRHYLNRVLPRDIQVASVTPVPADFNARFDCRYREYRYFFPRAAYDVSLMQQAANRLLGTHDFRNFCKRDPSKTIENYERTILRSEIKPVHPDEPESSKRLYEYVIRGTAFLYHQVRCTMAVLFLIGQRQEPLELIDHLLDPASERPRLQMASEIPLILWDCAYEHPLASPAADPKAQRVLWEMWREEAIKACMLGALLGEPSSEDCLDRNVNQALIPKSTLF